MKITRERLRRLIKEEATRIDEQGDGDMSKAEIQVPVDSGETIFITLGTLEASVNRIREILQGKSEDQIARTDKGAGVGVALRKELDILERLPGAIKSQLGRLGLKD